MMRQPISVPKVEGICSKQAHADFPKQADGSQTYERELGQDGFFGQCTHMIHANAPTAWSSFTGPLQPRAFDLTKLQNIASNLWDLPRLLWNSHVDIRWWNLNSSMDYLARNSDGDQLLFIHAGVANLYCDYGHLEIREGDYVVLPRATMWRLDIVEPLQILLVEATDSHYCLPEKGLVGPHAIFDPAIMDVPSMNDMFRDQQVNQNHEWSVVIKRQNLQSCVKYTFNPLDALGWHGNLMPVRVNWRDIRPLMSHRYHLPPSAHTTFVANRFVICTFAPRPIESDPGALKVPFYHNNDDFDEFIFYHQGQFFSRDNIHPGMSTLHPCGFAHGPHPGAFATGTNFARKETDEVAVMIDTRDALEVGDVKNIEWIDYVHSWKGIQKP